MDCPYCYLMLNSPASIHIVLCICSSRMVPALPQKGQGIEHILLCVNIVSAPIQVEIVNNANMLTDYVLPVAAFLISLGTLIWSIWNNQRDRARIKVSVEQATFLTESAQPMLTITATQIGQSGKARVTGMGFIIRKQDWQITRPSSMNPLNDQLPKTLEAGDTANAFYEIEAIADVCQKNGIDPRDLRPFVRTTRKKILGKMPENAIAAIQDQTKESTSPHNS